MHGGSRNTPIYNSMAEELNTLLPDKCLIGSDVKAKIGNLVTEYRRKRKQQGKTGASPCTWKYYDMVDKLLGKSVSFLHPSHSCLTGERPYNDDSLLSDSMTIEQEQLLADIENVVVPEMNFTQVAQEVTDANPFAAINDEPIVHADFNPSATSSPSNAAAVSKLGTTVEVTPTPKKIVGPKKKKESFWHEVSKVQVENVGKLSLLSCCSRVDLMQQLVVKIDQVSDAASRTEGKMLDLLEHQTRLQQQSINNEREFLQGTSLNSSRTLSRRRTEFNEIPNFIFFYLYIYRDSFSNSFFISILNCSLIIHFRRIKTNVALLNV